MNFKKNLQDYMKIYPVFSKEICETVVKELENPNWKKHSYYDYTNEISKSFEDDLMINYTQIETHKKIMDEMWSVINKYIKELDVAWFDSWKGYTSIRYNKYEIGTKMNIHCDHIHSMFDGERKGIPVLSLLGTLNEDYEGGDLFFWDDIKVNIPVGHVAVFPSNFLYPHYVSTVTKGVRYSYVSWVW